MTLIRCALVAVLIGLALSCSQSSPAPAPPPPPPPPSTAWPLSDAQVQSLLAKKSFFGHQSVGGNIVQGIYDLIATDSRLTLRVVTSSDPASVSGPAFIEATIGANGDPASKDSAFASIVDGGFGAQSSIAMYKYCWIDINDSTDVQQMAQNYINNLNTLKARYPASKFVPITIPLTTDPSKNRNEFNKLIRQAFTGTAIFDLAEVESTHGDGSRSYSIVDGQTIYTLASEYTTDGGHLNDVGRQAAAKRLLITLSNL